MRNPGNKVVVLSKVHGFRVRNCQSTEQPDEKLTFNEWTSYLRGCLSPQSNIGERLLNEAKLIIIKESIKK